MKKANTDNNDIDKVFKEGLGDFQVPPPSFQKQMDASELDNALKSRLDSFETTPEAHNWDQIKRRIPLSLQMQRHLNFWSKVAAVLVVGLVSSLLIANYQGSNNNSGEHAVIPTAPIEDVAENDDILDMKSDTPSPVQRFKEDKETAMELLNEVVIERTPTTELPPLDDKPMGDIAQEGNPLDAKLKRTDGEMDKMNQGLSKESEVLISQKPDEKKASTAGQQQ